MNIKVWTDFSKRENSTKQPAGGTTLDVHLKGPCSLHNPIFVLSNPIGKYTYVEAFGEYYFVDDVINLNDNMCEVHCRKDPMATYKTAIGNTTAFILYDTTANSEIPDDRLSTNTTPGISTSTHALGSFFSSSGTFVVTVTGTASTQSYIIDWTDIKNLIPDIRQQVQDFFPQATGSLDADFIPTLTSAIFQLVGAGSVADNIRDVRWVPFSFTGGSNETIYAGVYNTGRRGSPVNMAGSSRITGIGFNISIPWQFSDWRNAEPYTYIYAWIPYVGVVNIPASSVKGQSNLNVQCYADKITGDIAIKLSSGGVVVGSYGASTGVSIPLGNTTVPLSNLLTSLASVPSMIAGGPAGMMTGVARAGSTFLPLTQSVGGISSASATGLGFDMQVFTVCHGTTVSPSSVSSSIGTPAMAQKQIGTLSGYVQCQNASVDLPAEVSDREIINSYLNTGFFYE